MNALVCIHLKKPGSKKITITGPDNICEPVLNFLIMRLVNDKFTFTLQFKGQEGQT